jgi:hypothetical protein
MENKRKASEMLKYRNTRSKLWKERFEMVKRVGYETYHNYDQRKKNSLLKETRSMVLRKERKAKATLRKSLNTTVTHAASAENLNI